MNTVHNTAIRLKINHFVFAWYYKRVPNHFRQWPILKSIKLLIDNYEHQKFVDKGKDEVISRAIKREEELKKEIANLRFQILSVDEQVRSINKTFGTDFNEPSSN